MTLAVESPKGKFDHVIAMNAPGTGGQYRFMHKSYAADAQRLWLGIRPTGGFERVIDRVAGVMGTAKAEA